MPTIIVVLVVIVVLLSGDCTYGYFDLFGALCYAA